MHNHVPRRNRNADSTVWDWEVNNPQENINALKVQTALEGGGGIYTAILLHLEQKTIRKIKLYQKKRRNAFKINIFEWRRLKLWYLGCYDQVCAFQANITCGEYLECTPMWIIFPTCKAAVNFSILLKCQP